MFILIHPTVPKSSGKLRLRCFDMLSEKGHVGRSTFGVPCAPVPVPLCQSVQASLWTWQRRCTGLCMVLQNNPRSSTRSHEILYIFHFLTQSYTLCNLSNPPTLLPKTWASHQFTLYVQPFVESSFLYLAQKWLTPGDSAFPVTLSSSGCFLSYFFHPSLWPFLNILSSFFSQIPSIFEDYGISVILPTVVISVAEDLTTQIAISVSLIPKFLLDYTSASFASALAKLRSLAGIQAKTQSLYTPHSVNTMTLLYPTAYTFALGWMATLFNNTYWSYGGQVPMIWTLTNGKGRWERAGHINTPLSLPFMACSNVCFPLANFPGKLHIISENTCWLSVSFIGVLLSTASHYITCIFLWLISLTFFIFTVLDFHQLIKCRHFNRFHVLFPESLKQWQIVNICEYILWKSEGSQ